MHIIRWILLALALEGGMAITPTPIRAENADTIPLPAPRTANGRPLMQCLRDRQSNRHYSPRALPPQTLGDLLWAAFGINRPGDGKRTAPSATNAQEIDLFVATAEGLFRYDAEDHALTRIHSRDIRALTGSQEFVREAPVSLVYVANFNRLAQFPQPEREFYAAADTGFISQNVYLFCASEGLATVVHAVDQGDRLRTALNLNPGQKVILAQPVGFPAEATSGRN